jgi:ArsR family transcriptional regulator, lead/cadmium/zinc/bismuth-responsive transcriptional repressor
LLRLCLNICSYSKNLSRKKTMDQNTMMPLRVVHSGRVKAARREASPEDEVQRLATIYRVLGDPSRLKIVMALRREEMCVCDLAALTGISESAVSHQLRRLKDLSLVKARREGQVVYYALDDKHVVLLLDIGLRHVRE